MTPGVCEGPGDSCRKGEAMIGIFRSLKREEKIREAAIQQGRIEGRQESAEEYARLLTQWIGPIAADLMWKAMLEKDEQIKKEKAAQASAE